jgi:hypothetical protein
MLHSQVRQHWLHLGIAKLLGQEGFHFAVCVREKRFVDKIYGSRRAFDVQQKDFDLRMF